MQASRSCVPHQFAQSPPHAIPLDGVADLARDRKTDAPTRLVHSPARLQQECFAGGSCSGSGSAKVRSAPQPIHVEQRLNGKPRPLRTQSLASPRAARRHNLPAAFGRHAGPEAMAAFAHQLAGLIGSFHETVSAGALGAGPVAPTTARKRGIGAAYTGAPPSRQRNRPCARRHAARHRKPGLLAVFARLRPYSSTAPVAVTPPRRYVCYKICVTRPRL